MTGKYKIKCVSAQNQASYTAVMSSSASAYDVKYRIHHDCHKMYEKVEVWEQNADYRHRSNGFRFRIRFLGTNDNPGQYEVVSDDTTPLKAGEAQLDMVAKTIVEGGKNLFYDAIPFENLKTYEEMPQVMVTIGGKPAVCHNLNCHFNYTKAVGEVTGFTFDEATRVLDIQGTDLPVKEHVDRVEFAHSTCKVDHEKSSATAIKCTLDYQQTCGKWKPIVTAKLGLIPVNSAVKEQ